MHRTFCTLPCYDCGCSPSRPHCINILNGACPHPVLKSSRRPAYIGNADNEIALAELVNAHCATFPGHGRFIIAQEVETGRYLPRSAQDMELVEMLTAQEAQAS